MLNAWNVGQAGLGAGCDEDVPGRVMLAIYRDGVAVDEARFAFDFVDPQLSEVPVIPGIDSVNIFFPARRSNP